MNKLVKIIVTELAIGLVAFFWYRFSIADSTDWVSGIGLVLIFVLTVALVAATLIAASIEKLIENRKSAVSGLPTKRYGLKFWVIGMVLFVLFVSTLPYT